MMVDSYDQIRSIVSEYPTRRIAILGKGPSLGQIDRSALEEFIVININDSERFFPGDFAVLHSAWAYHSVKANGFQSKCYVSDLEFPSDVDHIRVPYEPDTFDSIETSLERFRDDSLSVSDVLLVLALKLAVEIARVLDRQFEVYMLGFDFGGEGALPVEDFSGHDDAFKQVFLRTQQDHFLHIHRYFRSATREIVVFHVGNLAFSDLTVGQFSGRALFDSSSEQPLAVFNQKEAYERLVRQIDEGHVIVVAEFTTNHIGDPKRLVRMVELAKEAGADFIKVQKRNVDTFYAAEELASEYRSPFGTTLGEYRRAVELDSQLVEILQRECARNDISWFASVLDLASLEFLSDYNLPLIKIPSTISDHRNYIEMVARKWPGDVVVSTGFTDAEYEEFVLDRFCDNRRLFLLQCTSSYPTAPEACQIGVIRHYDELRQLRYSNLIPGFSSHDVGSIGCMLAVAAGAMMIEKHVKLGNLDWVHFDGVALDLETTAFRDFVKEVRLAETFCGQRIKQIDDSEHHKYVPNPSHN